MNETPNSALNFSKPEAEMLEALRQEMGLATIEEVLRALVRQAFHRTQILCPSCGGHARKTVEGKAECEACMSVLNLADGMLVTLTGRRKN